jgi:tRNA(fMet)-specific endonuclease VapC
MFLLDTDHIGIIQKKTEPEFNRLSVRISQHAITSFYFSIISFHEQVMGWNAYIGRAREVRGVVKGYAQFQQILADFASAQVLPFDQAAAAVFTDLRKQKWRVPTMDLRIAAIALARDMTVLTRNLSDFGKIPRLRVEDWTG